jgi:H+/Cl- antiporter ClcA
MKLPRNKSLRRIRRLMLSPKMWRRRLVFWLGAIAIGVAASGFAMMADRAQDAFSALVAQWRYWPLIVSPVVFGLTAWLTAFFCPTAVGSGIPQAIAARTLRTEESHRYLLGPQIILGKMLLTGLALLGGASVGREGPTVQVGAAIMVLCAGLGGVSRQRGVVLAGAAAGVAAAFNTPLAGIVFAIEEMARSFQHRNSSVVLTAIVLSGAAAMSITGNYSYFGYANAPFDILRDWWPVLVIGGVGGLCGSLFAWMMVDGTKLIKTAGGGWLKRHPIVFATACGMVIACLGILTHGTTFGTGYGMANDLLHGRTSASWLYVLAKFWATVLSNVSGIPGGLFSPSLTVGASLGSSMAHWFAHTPEQDIILLAMVAYFAGVTQAPITAFVIVIEITGKGVMPAPLIATAVIAATIARMLTPESLYHHMAHGFVEQTKAAFPESKSLDAPPAEAPALIAQE